jgi:hypothetical protein
MTNFKNRIKRLEIIKTNDPLVVYIYKWAVGNGEINRVYYGNHIIERQENELDAEYMNRVEAEIIKLANPNQKVLTAFASYS